MQNPSMPNIPNMSRSLMSTACAWSPRQSPLRTARQRRRDGNTPTLSSELRIGLVIARASRFDPSGDHGRLINKRREAEPPQTLRTVADG